jgi:hypothetical protein
VDVQAVRVWRLAACRAVGDALAPEALEPVYGELPPRDAAGEDDGPSPEDVAAVQVQLTSRDVDSRNRARHEDLGAEPSRLLQRPARKLVPGHARREAEVVLDSGGGAGLAAGRLPLDDDRLQPLRRSVHRGGQSRRARADDHGVVLRDRGLGAKAEQLGHAAGLGPDHGLAADDLDRRQVRLGR